jgi:hypothetical protein
MKFIRNSYNGAGPSKYKIMKMFSCRELDVVLLEWFSKKVKVKLSHNRPWRPIGL